MIYGYLLKCLKMQPKRVSLELLAKASELAEEAGVHAFW